jgi:heptaprenylglyceryl phosphate synthase
MRTPEQVRAAREAGADFVVVGSMIEAAGADAIRALAAAAAPPHPR